MADLTFRQCVHLSRSTVHAFLSNHLPSSTIMSHHPPQHQFKTLMYHSLHYITSIFSPPTTREKIENQQTKLKLPALPSQMSGYEGTCIIPPPPPTHPFLLGLTISPSSNSNLPPVLIKATASFALRSQKLGEMGTYPSF